MLDAGQTPPALQPLVASNEATRLETDLKAMFLSAFESMLRAAERRVNALGAPHLGDFDLVQRSIKRDGLAMYSSADQGAMRYLFKAWRARNPRRGLAFTAAYLQLLFPNLWTLTQMWQDKSLAYPSGLLSADNGNSFLTSRVRITIGGLSDTQNVIAVAGALRSTVPARIVVSILVSADPVGVDTVSIANGSGGFLSGTFTGTIG